MAKLGEIRNGRNEKWGMGEIILPWELQRVVWNKKSCLYAVKMKRHQTTEGRGKRKAGANCARISLTSHSALYTFIRMRFYFRSWKEAWMVAKLSKAKMRNGHRWSYEWSTFTPELKSEIQIYPRGYTVRTHASFRVTNLWAKMKLVLQVLKTYQVLYKILEVRRHVLRCHISSSLSLSRKTNKDNFYY